MPNRSQSCNVIGMVRNALLISFFASRVLGSSLRTASSTVLYLADSIVYERKEHLLYSDE